jgi:hypothetical protein
MAKANFLKRIKTKGNDELPEKVIRQVRAIVTDKKKFNPLDIMKGNKAAGGLARWCIAMFDYAGAMKIAKPLQAQVKQMTDTFNQAQEALAAKKAEVDLIKANLKKMEDEQREMCELIERLTMERDQC